MSNSGLTRRAPASGQSRKDRQRSRVRPATSSVFARPRLLDADRVPRRRPWPRALGSTCISPGPHRAEARSHPFFAVPQGSSAIRTFTSKTNCRVRSPNSASASVTLCCATVTRFGRLPASQSDQSSWPSTPLLCGYPAALRWPPRLQPSARGAPCLTQQALRFGDSLPRSEDFATIFQCPLDDFRRRHGAVLRGLARRRTSRRCTSTPKARRTNERSA